MEYRHCCKNLSPCLKVCEYDMSAILRLFTKYNIISLTMNGSKNDSTIDNINP